MNASLSTITGTSTVPSIRGWRACAQHLDNPSGREEERMEFTNSLTRMVLLLVTGVEEERCE